MTTSAPENTPLYQVISFLVTWIEFFARSYLRIKANYDAVLYVAQAPTTNYRYHSYRKHHQRKQSVYSPSNSIHACRKLAPSSTIPIQHPIRGDVPAYASRRNKRRLAPLYYGVSKVTRTCDPVIMERPEPSVAIAISC